MGSSYRDRPPQSPEIPLIDRRCVLDDSIMRLQQPLDRPKRQDRENAAPGTAPLMVAPRHATGPWMSECGSRSLVATLLGRGGGRALVRSAYGTPCSNPRPLVSGYAYHPATTSVIDRAAPADSSGRVIGLNERAPVLENFAGLLLRTASRQPDRTAVVAPEHTCSTPNSPAERVASPRPSSVRVSSRATGLPSSYRGASKRAQRSSACSRAQLSPYRSMGH